jgi:hypothetical protein
MCCAEPTQVALGPLGLFGVLVAPVWRPKVLAYIVCICNVLCMIFRLRSSETDA